MKYDWKFFRCMFFSLVLVFVSTFQVLANVPGDSAAGDGVVAASDSATVYYDDVMMMSVNDDLSGYTKLPVYYIESGDLSPRAQYGNVISNVGSQRIRFVFNPFPLNNSGSFVSIDSVCVLTFSDGYDKDKIFVTSDTTSITGVGGFAFYPYSFTSRMMPTGFSYVDDNTIKIACSYTWDSPTYCTSNIGCGIDFDGGALKLGSSVKVDVYVRTMPVSVSVEGGGEGGGTVDNPSGGGSATLRT